MTTKASQPPSTGSGGCLVVRDLGRLAYAEALDLQRRLQREVIERRDAPAEVPRPMHLLLLEHDPPVITIPRRAEARDHLLAGEQQLQQRGVEVRQTDRGGDITWHGPGQLVVYPILDLNVLNLRLRSYMRFLEQVVIDTLAVYGISGNRDPDATGVWVASSEEGPTRKICAMGVRLTRWVSMHGVALNVAPDLEHFDLIVPCGLAGRGVTSMQQLLGEACPTMDQVKAEVTRRFEMEIGARAKSSR